MAFESSVFDSESFAGGDFCCTVCSVGSCLKDIGLVKYGVEDVVSLLLYDCSGTTGSDFTGNG